MSAGLGLEKPNSDRDRGETFFPNSGSDLDSDETFQIPRNVGLDIDEIVCLLDSQLCLKQTISTTSIVKRYNYLSILSEISSTAQQPIEKQH